MLGLYEQLEGELDAAGFFHPPEKRPSMVRNLRAALARAALHRPGGAHLPRRGHRALEGPRPGAGQAGREEGARRRRLSPTPRPPKLLPLACRRGGMHSMQRLDIDTVAGLLDGHVDLRRRPGAIQPLRYPFADTLFLDPFTRWVASCAAGVRLRLVSDTRSLRVSPPPSGRLRRRARPTTSSTSTASSASASRRAAARRSTDGGRSSGDERAVVGFDDLSGRREAARALVAADRHRLDHRPRDRRRRERRALAGRAPDRRLPRQLDLPLHGGRRRLGLLAGGGGGRWATCA